MNSAQAGPPAAWRPPRPWLTRDVADAVLALTGAATLGAAFQSLTPEGVEFIRVVRAQYRSDVRERKHTIVEADLGADPAGVADARTARAMAGPGGGHRCGVERADAGKTPVA
jgi:hypothetical protein